MGRQAIFLDKDGTLIEDVPFNVHPERIRLLPGAAEGIALFHRLGYRIFVISNQSGVARGLFPVEALGHVGRRLRELLTEADVPLSGFYFCPHHPDGSIIEYAVNCSCRKPKPGLIVQAAAEHAIDLESSWFLGDILDDVEAGARAGCRTVLIDNGHETEWVRSPLRTPSLVACDLLEAAHEIRKLEGHPALEKPDAHYPRAWGL